MNTKQLSTIPIKLDMAIDELTFYDKCGISLFSSLHNTRRHSHVPQRPCRYGDASAAASDDQSVRLARRDPVLLRPPGHHGLRDERSRTPLPVPQGLTPRLLHRSGIFISQTVFGAVQNLSDIHPDPRRKNLASICRRILVRYRPRSRSKTLRVSARRRCAQSCRGLVSLRSTTIRLRVFRR